MERRRGAFDVRIDVSAWTLFRLLNNAVPGDWEEQAVRGAVSLPRRGVLGGGTLAE